MPQETGKYITEHIKSGQYFKDAKDWYALRYVYPITQRSFLIVITVLSVVMAFVAIKVFATFLPLVEIVPIAVDVQSKVAQHSQLQTLSQGKENPNESLIKYLVMRYIEARENYTYASHVEGDKLKYLKGSSSREVFEQYKEYIAFDNPDSPILRYKKYRTRGIELLEVKILGGEFSANRDDFKVVARYRANEYSNGKFRSSLWLSKMEIVFDEVQYSKEVKKFSPLNFKVKFYEVSKIGDE